MKNGSKLNFILLSFALGQLVGNLKKKKASKPKANIKFEQYINRFSEFYDLNHIIFVEDEFSTLVNAGFSPDAAFNLIVCSGKAYD